jgi:hypothetical protein
VQAWAVICYDRPVLKLLSLAIEPGFFALRTDPTVRISPVPRIIAIPPNPRRKSNGEPVSRFEWDFRQAAGEKYAWPVGVRDSDPFRRAITRQGAVANRFPWTQAARN